MENLITTEKRAVIEIERTLGGFVAQKVEYYNKIPNVPVSHDTHFEICTTKTLEESKDIALDYIKKSGWTVYGTVEGVGNKHRILCGYPTNMEEGSTINQIYIYCTKDVDGITVYEAVDGTKGYADGIITQTRGLHRCLCVVFDYAKELGYEILSDHVDEIGVHRYFFEESYRAPKHTKESKSPIGIKDVDYHQPTHDVLLKTPEKVLNYIMLLQESKTLVLFRGVLDETETFRLKNPFTGVSEDVLFYRNIDDAIEGGAIIKVEVLNLDSLKVPSF